MLVVNYLSIMATTWSIFNRYTSTFQSHKTRYNCKPFIICKTSKIKFFQVCTETGMDSLYLRHPPVSSTFLWKRQNQVWVAEEEWWIRHNPDFLQKCRAARWTLREAGSPKIRSGQTSGETSWCEQWIWPNLFPRAHRRCRRIKRSRRRKGRRPSWPAGSTSILPCSWGRFVLHEQSTKESSF